MTVMARAIAAALLALLLCPSQGLARTGLDCVFEGYGADPARYDAHFERRGDEFIEPHWPASLAFRVLVDTREALIAVHAYATPPSFRRDAAGTAVILFVDKLNGRAQRSTVTSGRENQVQEGTCRRTR